MARALRERHRRGFTAVDLLVALAIGGLLLTAALPSVLGGMRADRVRDAAEAVAARIQGARRLAVTEGAQYLLVWREDGSDLCVVKDLDQDLVPDADEPREGPFGLPDGVRVRSLPEDPFSTSVLALRPTGDAHEAGTLELREGHRRGARLSITSSGAICTVRPG